MSDYVLALKLIEAGYPQPKDTSPYQGRYVSSSGTVHPRAVEEMLETGQAAYLPSLSELINDCGDEFLELGKYKQSHSKKGLFWAFATKFLFTKSVRRWVAGGTNGQGWQWVYKGEGKTPEEAMINLWLEINK